MAFLKDNKVVSFLLNIGSYIQKSQITNYVLFFATIFTTAWCGTKLFEGSLSAGITFSIAIMIILLVHEMGHYLNAKDHGIDTSLPYFIPLPVFIGTMGAVMFFKSRIPNRNALMDTGAAGPLCGFIVSVVALVIGMFLAPVSADPKSSFLGVSLLYYGLAYLIKGVSPAYIAVTPLVFAGWLGLFITMLNLLPIGQLDGGHVVYAMFGKSKYYPEGMKRFFQLFLAWGVICFLFYHNLTWLFFGGLIYFLGGKTVLHPPVENEMVELTLWNKVKGWICLAIFILTFMPAPFVSIVAKGGI